MKYLFRVSIILYFVGCAVSSNLVAQEQVPLIYAEILTPNGDGNNDFFVIQNIKEYPINKIHIFNRWGDKVFEAEPYENNWEGTSNAKNQYFGTRVPEGTYFYRFEYLIGDYAAEQNGKVILKR